MTDEIQDWAKIAAYREANPAHGSSDAVILRHWCDRSPALHALARRIQRDDKPPVDPLLLEARELAVTFYRSQGWPAGAVEKGRCDDGSAVKAAYKYLKGKQNG